MRASPDALLQHPAAVPALERTESGELSDALLERLNIRRPGLGRRLSPLACTLFSAAIGFTTIGVGKAIASEDAPRAEHRQQVMREAAPASASLQVRGATERSAHREYVERRLQVDGLHQALGINEQQFAERLVEALDPLMGGRQHRLTYTRTAVSLDATYFGLRPGTQLATQWEELARHQLGEDGSHELTIREASLDGQHQHLDVQRMLVTIIHEMTHGLGRERLPYFIDRVRTGNGIPFTYTQQFLAAGRQGEPINHEHMGDEYRSKLIECFFLVRDIPQGVSVEDAVTQYILDRYQVSEDVVRQDVREVISWFPPGTWERSLKMYQRFLRETGIEFEVHTLEERVIHPLEDEGLQSELSSILHRRVPSQVNQLYALPPSGPDQQALVREVRAYQSLLTTQIETEVTAQYPELVPFLHDWKQTVRLIAGRNQYHTKSFQYGHQSTVSEHLRNRTVDRRMVDGDHLAGFISEMEGINTTRLNTEWNQIPPETQEALRPIMLEYARAISRTFALPGEYRERATQFLH